MQKGVVMLCLATVAMGVTPDEKVKESKIITLPKVDIAPKTLDAAPDKKEVILPADAPKAGISGGGKGQMTNNIYSRRQEDATSLSTSKDVQTVRIATDSSQHSQSADLGAVSDLKTVTEKDTKVVQESVPGNIITTSVKDATIPPKGPEDKTPTGKDSAPATDSIKSGEHPKMPPTSKPEPILPADQINLDIKLQAWTLEDAIGRLHALSKDIRLGRLRVEMNVRMSSFGLFLRDEQKPEAETGKQGIAVGEKMGSAEKVKQEETANLDSADLGKPRPMPRYNYEEAMKEGLFNGDGSIFPSAGQQLVEKPALSAPEQQIDEKPKP